VQWWDGEKRDVKTRGDRYPHKEEKWRRFSRVGFSNWLVWRQGKLPEVDGAGRDRILDAKSKN
jgi:hypothetical protein